MSGLQRLAGKSALITGGNTGIGRAVALAYASEGADVAVCYVAREDDALSLVAEIRANGGRALALRADITVENDVVTLFKNVNAEFGKLDILVNNAGIQRPQPIIEMSVADWDRMMSVHLRGANPGHQTMRIVFTRHIADCHVSALACIGQRHCAADPGIATGDQRALTSQTLHIAHFSSRNKRPQPCTRFGSTPVTCKHFQTTMEMVS